LGRNSVFLGIMLQNQCIQLKVRIQYRICSKTIRLCAGLHLLLLFFFIPQSLDAQASDCWIPVTAHGLNGFIDANGKPHFPFGPSHLLNLGNGLIAANEREQVHYWERRPERICPLFPFGRTGILDTTGKWLVLPASDHIGDFGKGVYWLCNGGKVANYCTEPHHVEGGRYTLVNRNGILVDSLDDIALGFVNGHTPVYKDERIALMDSTGELVTGFVFDKVVANQRYSMEARQGLPDLRLWKLALRRDGHWVSLMPDGRLLPLDWPAQLEMEDRPIGWRKQASNWISRYMPPMLPCRESPDDHRNGHLIPKDLSYAENFPSDLRLEEICADMRAKALANIGLEVRVRRKKQALALLGGKRLTEFGLDRYEPAKGGMVLVSHPAFPSRTGRRKAQTAGVQVGNDFSSTGEAGEPTLELGVVDRNGRSIVPTKFSEIDVIPELDFIYARNALGNTCYTMHGEIFAISEEPLYFESVGKGCLSYMTGEWSVVMDRLHNVLVRDKFGHQECEVQDGWLWYRWGYDGGYHGRQIEGDSAAGPIYGSGNPAIIYKFLKAHPEYDSDSCEMDHLENGQWRFGKNGVWGLCDSDGKVLLPREYESIAQIGDLVWVKKNGLVGLNAVTGKVIFPAEFVEIQSVGCGFFRCRKSIDGKMMQAIVNLEGNYIWQWTVE
jgi:hypothetical protein